MSNSEQADDALKRLDQVRANYPLVSLEVEGRRWSYRETKRGAPQSPPVLLLPGIQGGGDVFFEVAHAIGTDHALLLVSAPDITDVSEMTSATAAFLDAIGVGVVHIVGSSLGAYLAQDFARAFPYRLGLLVLANGFYDPAPFLAHAPPAATIERTDAAQLVAQNMAPILDQPDDDPGIARLTAVMKVLVGPVQPVENYKSRLLLLTGAGAIERPPIRDDRVVLIDDDHDPMLPSAMRLALRQRFAAAELHPVAGGGHLPAIQRPDVFNSILRGRLGSSVAV